MDGLPFFSISRDYPPPKADDRRGRPKGAKHPWDMLEVGESMLVPDRHTSRAAHIWGYRHQRKFVSRTMKYKPYAIRIWRVA